MNIRGTETWWNSNHDWNTGTVGHAVFRKDKNKWTWAASYINYLKGNKDIRRESMDEAQSG